MTALASDDAFEDRFFAEHDDILALDEKDAGTFRTTADWLCGLPANWPGEPVPAWAIERVLDDYDSGLRRRARLRQLSQDRFRQTKQCAERAQDS